MTRSRRPGIALFIVIAALAAPGAAAAHVGKTPPVATNFTARITNAIPGIETRVVDGDQTLWLEAGTHTVTVPGIQGEPLLRFDAGGVWLNLRSLTAQTDRIDIYDLQPNPNPHAPPRWHHLTGAHTYEWHEHRLHLLEPLANDSSRPEALGRWTIPLLVDGRREILGGVLDYRPPPSASLWIGITALLAAVGAYLAWRSNRTTILLALAIVPTVWALRIARELYGRPTVGAIGWIEVALTSLAGIALLYGLRRTDRSVRVFAAFLAAFGALYQGATMYPVLTRAIALTQLPTTVARACVTLAFSLGAATLVGSWNGLLAEQVASRENEPPEREPEPEHKTRATHSGAV